ncbi:spermatogenesis-associated protein 20 [Rhincodon typus]|uniref:spermatogenesis-associated protein 20 n=1 Tax=Rhincodon typus TaxID=259920 RepID=UPI00202F43AC|nr:spermatogenesis-associated protein 20 [Rhincodon typus]
MLHCLGRGRCLALCLDRAAASAWVTARAAIPHRSFPTRGLSKTAFVTMATGSSDGPRCSSGPKPKQHTNRLIHEKSPYLLQHANNPVDWYPWGEEAFAKAKKEDKPIFLSVGYSTCHWCHVMERESFENEEIGKIMNENFVCIKVDREERPDVDKVYMTFVQATSGGGGWPMSVWLTPDLKPFVGGTYFPPEDGFHRLGFKTVLKNLAGQWKRNRKDLTERSDKILTALQKGVEVSANKEAVPPPCARVMERCFEQLAHSYEDEYGGFCESPKFPSPVNFNFLFRFWALNKSEEKGAQALQMALHTLKMMALGGIHDHIGQGFHRYSTDRRWHVPHFEKMLYDQGQLAVSYIEAYQISGDTFFADVARDILLYVSRDLSDQSGGFYSAEDADSYPTTESIDKKEGAFCVWTEKEIRQLLRDPIPDATENITMADVFSYHYDVKERGNVNPAQDSSQEYQGHSSPAVHNKEGLMISGFARVGAVLGEKGYIQRALRAAGFLREHMFDSSSGRLLRSCYRGDERVVEQTATPIHGFLDDYAFIIRGLIDLYEASFDEQWLEWAVKLQQIQDTLFWDAKGFAYFSDDAQDPSVLIRLKENQDGAEPSGNAVAASNLVRLANFANRPDWSDRSRQLVAAFTKLLDSMPIALPEMVTALMVQHYPLKQSCCVNTRSCC